MNAITRDISKQLKFRVLPKMDKVHSKNTEVIIEEEKKQKKKEEKKIDFKKISKNIKDKTEALIPCTNQQIEDVVFLNDDTLIALEFVYYQKKCRYNKLEE